MSASDAVLGSGAAAAVLSGITLTAATTAPAATARFTRLGDMSADSSGRVRSDSKRKFLCRKRMVGEIDAVAGVLVRLEHQFHHR
ncbi:hypothetical protein GCM10022247_48830 [Allokutzneria multivorans]|uniref:Secreted protein n=1 Tax=Allokutzneria multivorans TaxID=1142134 RepID=A0ABP7T0U1_9PSEU